MKVNGPVKEVEDGWWETGFFSLLEWEFTGKQGQEAEMLHVVMIRARDSSKNSYLA